MNQITKNIWIGSYIDAQDITSLGENGIKSIICLDGCLSEKKPGDLGVEKIEVVQLIDGRGNSREVFLRAVRSLKMLATKHAPVLVHCHAGQSRSAALVCKFLMSEEGCTLAEAMKQLTSKRKVAIQAGLQEVLDF